MERIILITLKLAMIKKNITQRDVGMRALIPESKFSAIINGRVPISSNERKALCQILHKEDKELFKELY